MTQTCYKCSSSEASPVAFTWWGGVLGPRLLSHVKCAQCGTTYNARTGRPNTVGIAIYVAVVLAVLTAVLLALRLR